MREISGARPRYSFVVPIYNDGELAHDFCESMEKTFAELLGSSELAQDLEVIFVDDGSSNDSYAQLVRVADTFSFVRATQLSRNFGQHIAVSCGYRQARGKYVGMLNVDMEEPPDQIPLLLEVMERGKHDIVFGTRVGTKRPLLDRLTSFAFNFVLNKLTGYEVPVSISTLRIMNRRFLEAYNSLSESSRYIPGLELWLGFSRTYVPIRHTTSRRGKSSYNLRKRLGMAVNSILSFSDVPLKIVAGVGMAVAVVGFIMTALLNIGRLFFIDFQPGYASTVAIMVFLGGVQIFSVGLASLYIGRILKEVQNRPLYVVQSTYGFEKGETSV